MESGEVQRNDSGAVTMLHNEHVYKYYRFKGWVAEQRKRWMRREFMYQWAEDEREAQ